MSIARLSDNLLDGVSEIYFSQGFQSMLEHHILELTTSEEAQPIAIPNALGIQYNGDLYGLLITLGVPMQYHWATMRCNMMYGPNEFKSTHVNLIQPSFREIDELLAIYTTSSTVYLN